MLQVLRQTTMSRRGYFLTIFLKQHSQSWASLHIYYDLARFGRLMLIPRLQASMDQQKQLQQAGEQDAVLADSQKLQSSRQTHHQIDHMQQPVNGRACWEACRGVTFLICQHRSVRLTLLNVSSPATRASSLSFSCCFKPSTCGVQTPGNDEIVPKPDDGLQILLP